MKAGSTRDFSDWFFIPQAKTMEATSIAKGIINHQTTAAARPLPSSSSFFYAGLSLSLIVFRGSFLLLIVVQWYERIEMLEEIVSKWRQSPKHGYMKTVYGGALAWPLSHSLFVKCQEQNRTEPTHAAVTDRPTTRS
jgi:hypothetical protein